LAKLAAQIVLELIRSRAAHRHGDLLFSGVIETNFS
jgi:hypothetical protein